MTIRQHLLVVTGCTIVALGPLAFADDTPPAEPQREQAAPAAQRPAPAREQIDTLIQGLDSANFAVREEATRKLLAVGAPAVEPLAEAAQSHSLEVAVRAVGLLEKMYLAETDADVEAAEVALESLASSNVRSVSARADGILESNYPLRQERAIAKIELHGGKVVYSTANNFNPNPNVNPPDVGSKQIAYVLLGTEWKGDDGLKYVKRLTKLSTLYVIDGADVSEESIKELQQTLPQLIVQNRGRAYLGIAGFPHAQGCQVFQVKAGTAADKGGLQIDDVITQFEEKPVTDFETLIKMIGEKNPGDKVVLDVIRMGEHKKLTIVLDEWK